MESAGAGTPSQEDKPLLQKILLNFLVILNNHRKKWLLKIHTLHDSIRMMVNIIIIITRPYIPQKSYHQIIQLWKIMNGQTIKKQQGKLDKKSENIIMLLYLSDFFKKSNKFLWCHNHNPFWYIMDGCVTYVGISSHHTKPSQTKDKTISHHPCPFYYHYTIHLSPANNISMFKQKY